MAVVDIDVHFGNGTAELLRGDPRSFFASVHMIYGDDNDGNENSSSEQNSSSSIKNISKKEEKESNVGFYPSLLGTTEISDNYVSVGVFPPHPVQKERIYFGRQSTGQKKNFDLGPDKEFKIKEEQENNDINRKSDKNENTDINLFLPLQNQSPTSTVIVKCESDVDVDVEIEAEVEAFKNDSSDSMDVAMEMPDYCDGEKNIFLVSNHSVSDGADVITGEDALNGINRSGCDSTVSTTPLTSSARTLPVSVTSSAPFDRTFDTTPSSNIGDFRGVAGFRNALSDVIIPQVRTYVFLFITACDSVFYFTLPCIISILLLYLAIHLSNYLIIYISIYLFIYLSIYQSIHSFIHLFVYIFISSDDQIQSTAAHHFR